MEPSDGKDTTNAASTSKTNPDLPTLTKSPKTYITKRTPKLHQVSPGTEPVKIFKKTLVQSRPSLDTPGSATNVSSHDSTKPMPTLINKSALLHTALTTAAPKIKLVDVGKMVEPEENMFGSIGSIVISDVVGAADASVIESLSVENDSTRNEAHADSMDEQAGVVASSLNEECGMFETVTESEVEDPNFRSLTGNDSTDPFEEQQVDQTSYAEIVPVAGSSTESMHYQSEADTFNGYRCAIQQVELKLPCIMCNRNKIAKYNCKHRGRKLYVCNDDCFRRLNETEPFVILDEPFAKFYAPELVASNYKYVRQCAQCARCIIGTSGVCSWEAMDFCKESCLYRFQKKLSAACAECTKHVEYAQQGKYCVRFGCIIRQFCSSTCLEARKRKIRICSYCQKSIQRTKTSVGSKYFCNDICRGMYDNMQDPKRPPFLINPDDACCFVCKAEKAVQIEFDYHHSSYYFCSANCFTVFRFIQNCEPLPKKCHSCAKYVLQQYLETHALHYDNMVHYFCSDSCQHIYIITHRRVVPCLWCKVKKYNFDMIQKDDFYGSMIFTCSLNCLNHLVVTCESVLANQKTCHMCSKATGVYDLKLANGSSNMFCSNSCITMYQTQFSHTMLPQKRTRGRGRHVIPDKPSPLPVISSVCSLAPVLKKIVVIETIPDLPDIRNVGTMVSLLKSDAGTQVEKDMADVELQVNLQADEPPFSSVLVPIYVPFPFVTWRAPVPVPLPFPLVIPTPFLLPLTKRLSNKIMKDVKKVQVKTPSDPFEAELLMMAELVAAEKKEEAPQVPSEDEDVEDTAEGPYSPEPAEDTGAFGEDMLQMALKMASDYDEPAVDLEGALTATTITPSQAPAEVVDTPEEPQQGSSRPQLRGRRRGTNRTRYNAIRKSRRSMHDTPEEVAPEEVPAPQPMEPVEKPDAHLCLKYTFGVNAWKQWVATKNIDLERSSQRLKLFKNELLQLTSDELNYSLCLFVEEVRKPNGSEYAPDTIYYLCLGIQQYLYESGRIDNIFCDPYYEKFTDCLDAICQKFAALYNDSHYIVTRVEEEHLWESKQLGAHSPHVLLSTLMFFNTKHFNLVNVDEHMQLSFSHIMKHWKRNPNQPGVPKQPGSRNVLLRFYPPQQSLDGNSRKKKVYEQQENEENPLRCPVKLYEFYLSKCPESVKTRNDVFYLLPERSCVPDSPVWYSTMALDRPALEKMLHRVKMVKEINVALLTN